MMRAGMQARLLLLALVVAASPLLSSGFSPRFLSSSNRRLVPGARLLGSLATEEASVSPSSSSELRSRVGTADLDWPNIGFNYRDVNSHVKFVWRDGKWGPAELVRDNYIKMHIANTAMHYGQSAFEGLKAFQCKDGQVRIFRPQENAKRMTQSGARILMPATDADWFVDGIRKVVQDNIEFVPPYGSGGAMYIRPLLFGSGPRIGLQPSDEYTLLIMVMPVADYYKGGMKPTTAVVVEGYDRAAPRGVGNVKVAGNYAADLLPNTQAKHDGYPIALYLDAKTNTLVEEFSTSNFFAITKDGSAFVTPSSPTILPSITNKSLQQLAEDMGLRVEKRQVPISEVQSGAFGEVAACGTAVVLTGIKRIVCGGEVTDINGGSDEVGPVLQKLYDTLRGIQNGEIEDKHGWMTSL